MIEALRADLLRARSDGGGEVSVLHAVVNSHGFPALVDYRAGRWLRSARGRPAGWLLAPLLSPGYWLLAKAIQLLYDIRLEPSADIGPGLLIHHLGGIRVRDCRLGSNCVIHQEVVIEPAGEGLAGPHLGDRVWVGPHAQVVGAARVGDGATVGAGAVVTQDVPSHAMVLGNPARVARSNYDNSELP